MTAESLNQFRDAIGYVIATERKTWQRERELIQSQANETITLMRAELDVLKATVQSVMEKHDRLVKNRLEQLKDGEPGRDIDPAEVGTMIEAAVARAVDAIPIPKDGENGTSVVLAEVEPLVAEAVERAVAAIQLPRDGVDGLNGKDADQAEIEQLVAVAVSAIPVPKDGVDGLNGSDGKDGLNGKDGALPVVRSWADEVCYAGEVRTHEGSLWQAAKDTGRAPTTEDWICLAQRGYDGAPGASVDVRGLYSEGEEYRALSIVALNGGSFIATRDNPGPCPGDGWQLLASRGKAGEPKRGETGPRGDAGPAIVEAQINSDGLMTFVSADGTTATCDLYPVLSRMARSS